jgi:hypothetical protein
MYCAIVSACVDEEWRNYTADLPAGKTAGRLLPGYSQENHAVTGCIW